MVSDKTTTRTYEVFFPDPEDTREHLSYETQLFLQPCSHSQKDRLQTCTVSGNPTSSSTKKNKKRSYTLSLSLSHTHTHTHLHRDPRALRRGRENAFKHSADVTGRRTTSFPMDVPRIASRTKRQIPAAPPRLPPARTVGVVVQREEVIEALLRGGER